MPSTIVLCLANLAALTAAAVGNSSVESILALEGAPDQRHAKEAQIATAVAAETPRTDAVGMPALRQSLNQGQAASQAGQSGVVEALSEFRKFNAPLASRYVTVSKDGLYAKYTGPDRNDYCGVVYGDGAIPAFTEFGKYYEVRIEEAIAGKPDGLAIGVTAADPKYFLETFQVASVVPESWTLGYDGRAQTYGKNESRNTSWKPNQLKRGDRVGLLIRQDALVVYQNQVQVEILSVSNVPLKKTLYPVVDLLGGTVAVSLVPGAAPPGMMAVSTFIGMQPSDHEQSDRELEADVRGVHNKECNTSLNGDDLSILRAEYEEVFPSRGGSSPKDEHIANNVGKEANSEIKASSSSDVRSGNNSDSSDNGTSLNAVNDRSLENSLHTLRSELDNYEAVHSGKDRSVADILDNNATMPEQTTAEQSQQISNAALLTMIALVATLLGIGLARQFSSRPQLDGWADFWGEELERDTEEPTPGMRFVRGEKLD